MKKLSLHWDQRDKWAQQLEQQLDKTLWQHLNNAPHTGRDTLFRQ
jgi:uncharacterized lipoprotein YmbA